MPSSRSTLEIANIGHTVMDIDYWQLQMHDFYFAFIPAFLFIVFKKRFVSIFNFREIALYLLFKRTNETHGFFFSFSSMQALRYK